jgi:ribosomal protein S27AE
MAPGSMIIAVRRATFSLTALRLPITATALEREMSQSVADVLVSTLEQIGVRHIFGLIGDSLNPLADAVRRSKIEWVGSARCGAGGFWPSEIHRAACGLCRYDRPRFIQARFDPFIQVARHSKYAVPSRFGTYLDCSKRDLRVE